MPPCDQNFEQQGNAQWYANQWWDRAPQHHHTAMHLTKSQLPPHLIFACSSDSVGGSTWQSCLYMYDEQEALMGHTCILRMQIINGQVSPRPRKIFISPREIRCRTPLLEPLINGEISPGEQERLHQWYLDTKLSPAAAVQRQHISSLSLRDPISNKGDIRGHFSSVGVSHSGGHKTWPEAEPDISPPLPLWAGGHCLSSVTFDYSTMEKITLSSPSANIKASYRHGLLKLQQSDITHSLDMRIANAATLGDISSHLPSLWDHLHERRTVVPHWTVTTWLQKIHNAAQIVGISPLAADPSFSHVIYTDTAALPCLTNFDATRPAVIFVDGLTPALASILQNSLSSSSKWILIGSERARRQLLPWVSPTDLVHITALDKGQQLGIGSDFVHNARTAPIQIPNTLQLWILEPVDDDNMAISYDQLDGAILPALDTDLQRESLTHARWSHYHAAAQDAAHRDIRGVRAGTDGSISTVETEDGTEIRIGSGVAFISYPPFSYLPPTHARIHFDDTPSTLLAEGAAVALALQTTPTDEALYIATDSLNIMFILDHCTCKDYWISYDDHLNRDMIKAMCTALHRRTAPTHFLKVKSHSGVGINEEADRLAEQGCRSSRNILYEPNRIPRIEICRSVTNYPGVRIPSLTEIHEHHRAASVSATETFNLLTIPDMARHHLADYIHCPDDSRARHAKLILQCLTNTFPTQSRLHIIGASKSPECHCGHPRETMDHMTQTCPRLHDAITKAHNHIRDKVWPHIADTGSSTWVAWKETPIRNTLLTAYPPYTKRQPDGMAFNRSTMTWVLFDFTRCGNWDAQGMQAAFDRKIKIYADLMQHLTTHNPQYTFQFFPLVISSSAAVPEQQWTTALAAMDLDDGGISAAIVAAVQAACEAFEIIVNARYNSISQGQEPERRDLDSSRDEATASLLQDRVVRPTAQRIRRRSTAAVDQQAPSSQPSRTATV